MNKRGFTLIEIIVVIIILGILSVTLAIFVSNQLQAVVRSGEFANAVNLARLEAEIVNSTAYASLTTGTTTTTNYKTYPYDVIRTVSYISGTDLTAESLKQITIVVRPNGKSNNLVTYTTYRAKNITFGL
jgi:prepilin-type N-terminal cleavage/methylation domain-containing protein